MSETICESTPKRSRRRWVVVAKLAFGIGLMTALVVHADLYDLIVSLKSVDPYYLFIMFLLPHAMIAVNTLKWKMFLSEMDLSIGFPRLFALYLIATFFNNFLPTMVGGDAVRVYTLGRDVNDASSVTAATFLERIVGFAALVSLLPLSLLSRTITNAFPAIWLLVPLSVIGFVIGTAMLVSPRLDFLWRRLKAGKMFMPILHFLARTRDAVHRGARSKKVLLMSFALSLVFYGGAILTVWAAAKCFGVQPRITYLFATVPIVLVAGMLPISLNGLGITEAGFALLLQFSGVPAAESVGVGILLRARLFITALIGGLLFLKYRSMGAVRGKNQS